MTGDDVDLTIEVIPTVVGVAEAAEIMGWDKRRVITYIDRGSFPEPITTLASGRIWLREDVEEYAARWRETHPARTASLARDQPRPVPDPARAVGLRLGGGAFSTARGEQWDPPLSEDGREQAGCSPARLRVMDLEPFVIYASPLRRARETAEAFAAEVGAEVAFDDDLVEAHIGGWEGKPFEEIVETDPEIVQIVRNQQAIWHRAPGAEQADGFRARVHSAVETILDEHPDRNVARVRPRRRDQRLRRRAARPRPGDVLPAREHEPEQRRRRRRIRTVRFLNDVLHLTDPHFFE